MAYHGSLRTVQLALLGNNPVSKIDSDGGKADDWYRKLDKDGNPTDEYVWFDGIAIAATFDAIGLPSITAPRGTFVNGKRVVDFTTRTTNRAGKPNNGVALAFEDGSTMDITATRVKQKIPNTHPKAPLEAISAMMGHNKLSTTQIYLKSLPSNVLDSYQLELNSVM